MAKLKVFSFDFEKEYGGGVMLIAAKDEERAKELCPVNSMPFSGYWEYSGENKGLTYSGEEGIILEYTYVE